MNTNTRLEMCLKGLNEAYWLLHPLLEASKPGTGDRERVVQVLDGIDHAKNMAQVLGERWASGLSVG